MERRRVTGVVRPPAPRMRVPAGESPESDEDRLLEVLAGLAGRRNVTLVVVARDQAQRQRILALGLPEVLVPDGPADGVGLMAAADFVVGLGGVMLREAAALGTPAYTLSASAGPVEASLLGDGRLTPGRPRRMTSCCARRTRAPRWPRPATQASSATGSSRSAATRAGDSASAGWSRMRRARSLRASSESAELSRLPSQRA